MFQEQKWEAFYVICPTFRQPTYNPIRHLVTRHMHDLTEEGLARIERRQSKEDAPRALLLIDDCAGEQASNTGRKGSLPIIANNARWLNLSIIIITQNMSSITPSFRDNAEALCMFHTLNKKERKYLVEERNPFGDTTSMLTLLKAAHDEPHSFLFQVVTQKGVLHYKGLDKFLA